MQRSRVTCRAAAVSVLGLLWVATAAFTCPDICDCGSNGVVDCTRRGLTDVPANIPLNTTVLRLEHNNIRNLSDADFSYLTGLEELYLLYNNIHVLPDRVFSHLTSLKRLYLNNNIIRVLQGGVFLNLTRLNSLRLQNNHIADLPDGVFADLTSLQFLQLENNNILRLPIGVFSHLTNLWRLWLSGNHIADLPDGVFSNLISLWELHLDNNNIPSLPTGVFSQLSSLWDLRLSGNHIAELTDGVFSHLTSLTRLYLDSNNISSLPSDRIFSNLTKLKELRLSDNQITELPDELFSHLTSLKELRLDNNNISSLAPVFSNLTSLYIARNPWRCDCNLLGLLTSGHLRDKIHDLYVPICNSPPHMKGEALKEIAADKICQSRGDCTTGSAESICACNIGWTGPFCDKDENLAIGKKASQSSTQGAGAGAEKAVDGSTDDCAQTRREYQPWWKVDLAGYNKVNRISIMVPFHQQDTAGTTGTVRVGPNEDFSQNGQCGQKYMIDYSNPQAIVANCDPPMYGRYVSIQAIAPEGKPPTVLTLCEVKVYAKVTCCNHTISIPNGQIIASNGYCSGNLIRFSCDTGYKLVGSPFAVCRDKHWDQDIPTCQRICCDNTTEVMNGQVNSTEGYCFGNEIQFSCNPGYELVGRSSATCKGDGSWGQLPTCQLPSERNIVIAAVLGTIAFFTTCAVVYFSSKWWNKKRMRKEIKDLCDRLMGNAEGPSDGSQLHDVFVSYSSKDASWVQDILVKKLDKDYDVRYDERNFDGGESVIANIVNGIYQSRKVILVMSKNFIKSKWCIYEMALTYQRKLDLDEKCVVVIKYDDCEIPVCLALQTYLDWNEQIDEETFWDQLHKALRPAGISCVPSATYAALE